jgi:DNA-binding transcriptional MocR family regulator
MPQVITGHTAAEIAASLEAGIRQGRLVPGSPLPAVRTLASILGVSPATVASAYRSVRLRGLAMTRARLGTRVSFRPPVAPRRVAASPARGRDLSVGNPDPALLPRLAPVLRRLDPGPLLYGGATNDPRLHEIAARELDVDGIPAGALTVTAGALDALERVLGAYLLPGDIVAVEDPAYFATLDLLGALGLNIEPVAVDDSGMRPGELARALRRGASAVIIVPRAQNPTGAALDARRAAELRKVLDRSPNVLLVEDDFAGPISGASAHTLVNAKRGRWVVVRSVSKFLGPDLRVAVVAGDEATIARIEGRRRLGPGWVSHLLQRSVARLLADPEARKQVRRATEIYRSRRAALQDALAKQGIASHGRSGYNVWIPVPEEAPVIEGLLDAGWRVLAGERCRIRSGPAIRVTTSRLEPRDSLTFARDLSRCLSAPELARTG